MFRSVCLIFFVASLALAGNPTSCGSKLIAEAWKASLLRDGAVFGRLDDWVDPWLLTHVRESLVPEAQKIDSRFLFLQDVQLYSHRETFLELRTVMKRIASAALDCVELPTHRRQQAERSTIYFKGYEATSELFHNAERWHRDGGDMRIVLNVEGEGTEFWFGPWYWPRRRILQPGEFAVFMGEDLARVVKIPSPWHRAPKKHGGRASAFLLSPWIYR